MLQTVLQYGTGRAAATGQFAAGKTGTTSNYGDAWFIGWDSRYTVAVWVGYPDSLVPMTTAFNGNPVLGGTFPALIWHNFIVNAMAIDKARAENAAKPKGAKASGEGGTSSGESEVSAPPSSTPGTATSGPSGAPGGSSKGGEKPSAPGNTGGEGGAATPGKATAPSTPAPTHEPPTPAPPGTEPPASPSPSPSPTGGVSPGG